ncbi:MAG: phage tail tube protein [Dehalococcoidia bacterium]
MVRLGEGAFVSFGIVNGYATDGTSTNTTLPIRVQGGDLSMQFERDRLEFEDLDQIQNVSALVLGGQKRVTGTLTMRIAYSELGDILRILTGDNQAISISLNNTYAIKSPTDATHTFFGTTIRHIVMEVMTNDATNAIFYQGLEVTNFQFTFEANNYVTLQITFLGRDITRTAKSATPTYLSDYIASPSGQAALLFTLEGTTYRSNSVTVTVDLPLEHRYDVIDVAPSTHPLPTGKRTVTVEADIEAPDTDATLMSALEDPVANKFLGASTNKVDLVTDASNQLTLTFGDLWLNPPGEARPEGIGVLRASLSMLAKNDGTLDDLTILGKSPQSAYLITVV